MLRLKGSMISLREGVEEEKDFCASCSIKACMVCKEYLLEMPTALQRSGHVPRIFIDDDSPSIVLSQKRSPNEHVKRKVGIIEKLSKHIERFRSYSNYHDR